MPAITDPTTPTIDKNLLDGAVDFINRATHASGVQLAVTISEYIVDTFFGGDAALLSSKDSNKTASFRALCQRKDLNVGVSTLYRLVKIGQQARQLPVDVAENLTQGQHRALLSEPNPKHKQSLARQALQHHWTAEQLQAKIAEKHPQDKPRLGRPQKPALLKWLTALNRDSAHDVAKLTADFAGMTAKDQAQFRAELAEIQARLGAAHAAVGA